MRMKLEIGWHIVLDRPFDGIDVLARRDARAVAYAEDMGVDGLCRLAPPHVQDHIGRLAPHARQGLQRGARIGDLAAIFLDKDAAQLDDVLGLVAEKADRLDMLDHALLAEGEHLFGRIGHLEQLARGLVHARICGLRRQRDRHDKGEGIDMLELALRFRLRRLKPREDLSHLVVSKLFCHQETVCPQGRIGAMRNIRVAARHAAAYRAGMDHENAYHYKVVRRAIDIIDAAAPDLPALDALAAELGMSPAHFQRVFSRWVGVSPKRYQQFLMLGHAKTLLRDRFTTLETSLALGLSGSGRLHDLFIRWEAMSPGEFARQADGLLIRRGRFSTPFGPAIAYGTDRGLCGLGFLSEHDEDAARADLEGRWPGARFVDEPAPLRSWVEAAFAQSGETALHVIGAPFQIKVWEALLSVPSGHVTTYSRIAGAIGNPDAIRAVGTAVGRNPVSFLIPCHRAIRKSGGLGGYHWGLPVKRAMLAWESARAEA